MLITSRIQFSLCLVNQEPFEILTIDTTLDQNVSMLITSSTITSVEESGVWLSGSGLETMLRTTCRQYEPSCKYRGSCYDPGWQSWQLMARSFWYTRHPQCHCSWGPFLIEGQEWPAWYWRRVQLQILAWFQQHQGMVLQWWIWSPFARKCQQ